MNMTPWCLSFSHATFMLVASFVNLPVWSIIFVSLLYIILLVANIVEVTSLDFKIQRLEQKIEQLEAKEDDR